ncbi:hypothetical protein, partial [Actinobacillus pleuropneumoniae]
VFVGGRFLLLPLIDLPLKGMQALNEKPSGNIIQLGIFLPGLINKSIERFISEPSSIELEGIAESASNIFPLKRNGPVIG